VDAEQQARFDMLKAKAAGPGLSGDEANELGELYALESGAQYGNAGTDAGAEELALEDHQRQVKDEMLSKEEWAQMDQDRSRISFKEGGISAGYKPGARRPRSET
jgi:hypothetical protein